MTFKVSNNFISDYALEHFANYGYQAYGPVVPRYISVAFLKNWGDIRCLPIGRTKPCRRDLLNRDARAQAISSFVSLRILMG